MGDIGVPELLIILAIVLICFGPSKLAGLGKSLGDGIRSFRESVREDVRPPEMAQTSAETIPETPEPLDVIAVSE